MKSDDKQSVKNKQNNSDKITTGNYQHYKGGKYEVLGTGIHTETAEKVIIYKALYPPYETWVRPYEMFFDSVTVDDKEIPRFEKMED